jgi:uroporphyrinogen-III synthase
VTTRIVYRSEPVAQLSSQACVAAKTGAVALIHSARAGARFAELVDRSGIDRSRLGLAAISPAALDAAGEGWAECAAAPLPRDEALLALAAKLCHKRGGKGTAA